MKKNEIVIFESEDKTIVLKVPYESETVWLNRTQIAELFGRDIKTIGKHINNALKEEADEEVVVAKFATTTQHGAIEGKTQTHMTEYYSLDMILSVGYRLKSKRGIEFRRWANSVLKKYIIDGYAINEKRLEALERTVNIQTKMLANALDVEEEDILRAVNLYTEALTLLDQYDHQSLPKPEGSKAIYRITYEDCRKMVDQMEDYFKSDVFGVEKETGKVEGILEAVYQNVFGGEIYPSLEEKAANLLYFMIKDHPFVDDHVIILKESIGFRAKNRADSSERLNLL
ncbi:MAG: RhuM family protein [Catonella sp.]|uniref:RhuM family protein n=1 Tax=Catonella sp. TaxID=2382125 RepID=UPI003FA0936A